MKNFKSNSTVPRQINLKKELQPKNLSQGYPRYRPRAERLAVPFIKPVLASS